jgi:hypothetical protein
MGLQHKTRNNQSFLAAAESTPNPPQRARSRNVVSLTLVTAVLLLVACRNGNGATGPAATPTNHSAAAANPADRRQITSDPDDPCAGVNVRSKARIPYSDLAKPAKGQAVTDPDFGTTIRRITDAQADWGSTIAVPAYPTIQAWNADESLMVLYVTHGRHVGWALLNGKTYAFIRWLDINPADVEQFYWDTKNPDLLYYVDNTSDNTGKFLIRMHVSSGRKDRLHNFDDDIASDRPLAMCAGTTKISGGEDPFFMSYNNDLLGLGCYLNRNGPHGAALFGAFSYRISTNTIGHTFPSEAVVPQATPSGKAMYYYNNEKEIHVLNPLTDEDERTIAWNGGEHSDMLLNGAGDDVVAGVQFDGPSGSGTLMVANLSKGGVTTIIGKAAGDPYPPGGTLISGKAFRKPGWVAVAIVGNIRKTSTYLDQEILLANIDTGETCRVAHHRSTGNWSDAAQSNYWSQPNVVISPSGTRILFASDWGAARPGSSVTANPDAVVDTYVIELPTYKH